MQARLLGAPACNQVAAGAGAPGAHLFNHPSLPQPQPQPQSLFARSTHTQPLGSPPAVSYFVPPASGAYVSLADQSLSHSRPHSLLRQQSAVELLVDEQTGGAAAAAFLRNSHRLSTPTANAAQPPPASLASFVAGASAASNVNAAPQLVADPSRERLVQLQSTLRQQHTRLSQLLQSLSPGAGSGSGSQQSLSSVAAAAGVCGRVRDLGLGLEQQTTQTLSRQQLRINAAEFVLRSSDRLSHSRAAAAHGHASGLEGQLLVRVYCGRGLQTQGSASAALPMGMALANNGIGIGGGGGGGSLIKDLYCVLELDNVRRARSWIRTGIDEFEWDEAFELELENSRLLSLLIFHWEPSRAQHEHVLHFYGNLSLLHFLHEMQLQLRPSSASQPQPVRDSSSYKLALKLEPRGLLYLELAYRSIFSVLARLPRALSSARSSSFAVFGVRLELVLEREQTRLEALLLAADGTGAPPALLEQLRRQRVPVALKRAVDEIERRALDVPGIYRHACSLRPKQQLRERLELDDPLCADLSPDAVPDVHVLTGRIRFDSKICTHTRPH